MVSSLIYLDFLNLLSSGIALFNDIEIIRTNNRYTTYCSLTIIFVCMLCPLQYFPYDLGPVSQGREEFSHLESCSKISNLMITELFIHVFIISTKVPFIQKISGMYTSQFLHTNKLKMALRARKVSGAFKKQAPGPGWSAGRYMHMIYLLF